MHLPCCVRVLCARRVVVPAQAISNYGIAAQAVI